MKDLRGLLKEKFFEVIKQLKFILTRFERNGNNFQKIGRASCRERV